MYKLKSDGIEDDAREKKHDDLGVKRRGVPRSSIVRATRIYRLSSIEFSNGFSSLGDRHKP
jgi:hypothetical protein